MTTQSSLVPGRWKRLSIGFDEAMQRLPGALAAEGFGVITDIDLKQTFGAKLGLDFRRYRILGACNPTLAHAALQADLHLGVLLPCNIVLYEADDGSAVIGAVDPLQTLGALQGAPPLGALARQVGERLERVLAAIEA